jgi:hypothetical protein
VEYKNVKAARKTIKHFITFTYLHYNGSITKSYLTLAFIYVAELASRQMTTQDAETG